VRKDGKTRTEATRTLERATTADKNELMSGYGINFDDLPAWQRHGADLWWETYQRPGYNPIRKIDVAATRRRVHVERELPMKDAYRDTVDRLLAAGAEARQGR
jgi:tRNA(His) 5'-end guanylyltransferase